jgi:hypothetical protein
MNPILPESESYIMTDGQSVSLSWNKAPVWGLGPDFYYCQTVAGFLMWGALTKGRVCRLQLLLVLASAVILGSKSRGARDNILLSQIRDFLFRPLLRFAELGWRYSNPLHTGLILARMQYAFYNLARPVQKTPSPRGLLPLFTSGCDGNVCSFHSN